MNQPSPTSAGGLVSAGRARLLRCLLAVALMAALAPAAAQAAAGQRCSAYSVTQRSDGQAFTTHLYDLRAQGVSCQKLRQVLHRFFFGPNRPGGPLPSDGTRVGSWLVSLRMEYVYGADGHKRITGRYTATVNVN